MSGEMGLILAALERLEARTERIEARTERIEARTERIEARTDVLEQGMTRLRVDVMDRIDRLQDTLQSVRNDVVVNYANTERVERNVRNGEEQTRLLADQVNLMFKRILGIDERVRTLEEKR
jgi:CCR4-NOT transcriptional regulation complex NOT5 subunit